MIRRLKKRFVLLAMLALLTLLSLAIVGMNLMNYVSVIKESDTILDILSRNKGYFPFDDVPDKDTTALPPNMSPEIQHEARYFFVLMDPDGHLLKVDTGRIVTVDDEQALVYADRALELEKTIGFVDEFRFIKTSDDVGMRLVFLDCGRKLSSVRTFAAYSTLMAFVVYIMLFVIVMLAAERIVRPVADSYERQKRFITDAGHELKTPLTIINANADLSVMENGENEYLSEIKAQTGRMTELTERLVYLSKTEEGLGKGSLVPFSLSDIVTEVAASFEAPAQIACRRLCVEVTSSLSIHGDPEAIYRLTAILLDNAIKYSDANGQITVSLSKQGKHVHLCVSNTTAYPLTEEELSHIFDRFYRTDPSRNSTSGGFGIGLSIARAVADAHGGTISADMISDRTLSIRVTLPIKMS